jgi:hypothetical protein
MAESIANPFGDLQLCVRHTESKSEPRCSVSRAFERSRLHKKPPSTRCISALYAFTAGARWHFRTWLVVGSKDGIAQASSRSAAEIVSLAPDNSKHAELRGNGATNVMIV